MTTPLHDDAEARLFKTQAERSGPFGAYVPDEFQAFELGAQHVMNLIIAWIQEDPELKGQALIEKIEAYRRGAAEPPRAISAADLKVQEWIERSTWPQTGEPLL